MKKIDIKIKWFIPITLGLALILGLVLSCSSSTDSLLTAILNSDSVIVSLDLDGGTTTTELRSGCVLIGKPGLSLEVADPTKKGYTFAAWSPVLPATYPSEDSSYKATYTINTYQISYERNNADVTSMSHSNPATYKVTDAEITLSSATDTTSGGSKTFEGWYKEASCTNVITKIDAGSTGNIVLYAKWS